MRKFVILIVLMCVFTASALLGCTDPTDDRASEFTEPQYEWGKIKDTTFTVWGDKSDLDRVYIKKVFKLYETLTGNRIETVPLTKEQMNGEVQNAYNSDSAVLPDVLLWHGGTNLTSLNPDRNFLDFSEKVWVSDLMDTAINQTIYSGKVVGLPYGEASVSGTLYNKKIFKKYNLKVPKTQSEFMAVCATLLENGITPIYLPHEEKNATMLLYQFPLDSVLQDRDVLDALNEGTLTYSEMSEMKAIVSWYKTMSDKGYFGTNCGGDNWDGMDNAMKGGEYAMMLCWDTWLYTDYTGDPADFGLMPAFMGVPEEGTFEGPNLILSLVSSRGKNIAAAVDLITFMSDPYIYNQVFKDIYTMAIFKNQVGSISTPQYAESERLIERLFYDSTAWLRIKGFSQNDALFIHEYMKGSVTLEECLTKMDAARIKRAEEEKQIAER